MTSPSREYLVAEGRLLAKESPPDRWALGDLAVEAIPPGQTRAERSENQKRLLEFANDIGVSMNLIKDCYYTSIAWPPRLRIPGISHSKHSTHRTRHNRIEILLNEEMDDGLPSNRVRQQVARVEELIADKAVRTALVDRSVKRSRRMAALARAVEAEDVVQARLWARAELEQCKADQAAPEVLAAMAERFIKANASMARMTGDLLDLATVVEQVPEAYEERTVGSLQQVIAAAERALQVLRPELRKPQPRTVIDHEDPIGDRAADTG